MKKILKYLKNITYSNNWINIYHSVTFNISYDVCGYFDPRPRINICLFFYRISIILPVINVNFDNECVPPRYGIEYHSNILWLHYGGKGNYGGNKCKAIHMPWEINWHSTSLLLKDGTYAIETHENKLNFYDDKWYDPNKVYNETLPYTYTHKDDTIQNVNATIRVKIYNRRRNILKNSSLFNNIDKQLEVNFTLDINEVRETYYTMLENESPHECLKRMEKERKF